MPTRNNTTPECCIVGVCCLLLTTIGTYLVLSVVREEQPPRPAVAAEPVEGAELGEMFILLEPWCVGKGKSFSV